MKLYGSLFVAIAAISYGFPASLMKLASLQGAQIGGLLFFVFSLRLFFYRYFPLFPHENKNNNL